MWAVTDPNITLWVEAWKCHIHLERQQWIWIADNVLYETVMRYKRRRRYARRVYRRIRDWKHSWKGRNLKKVRNPRFCSY